MLCVSAVPETVVPPVWILGWVTKDVHLYYLIQFWSQETLSKFFSPLSVDASSMVSSETYCSLFRRKYRVLPCVLLLLVMLFQHPAQPYFVAQFSWKRKGEGLGRDGYVLGNLAGGNRRIFDIFRWEEMEILWDKVGFWFGHLYGPHFLRNFRKFLLCNFSWLAGCCYLGGVLFLTGFFFFNNISGIWWISHPLHCT